MKKAILLFSILVLLAASVQAEQWGSEELTLNTPIYYNNEKSQSIFQIKITGIEDKWWPAANVVKGEISVRIYNDKDTLTKLTCSALDDQYYTTFTLKEGQETSCFFAADSDNGGLAKKLGEDTEIVHVKFIEMINSKKVRMYTTANDGIVNVISNNTFVAPAPATPQIPSNPTAQPAAPAPASAPPQAPAQPVAIETASIFDEQPEPPPVNPPSMTGNEGVLEMLSKLNQNFISQLLELLGKKKV